MKNKVSVYEEITNQVIELLEAGTSPWVKPWNSKAGAIRNAATGKAYRGWNIFGLHITMQIAGYSDPRFLTFKQAKDLGGNVKKGEKSTTIYFWGSSIPKGKDEADRYFFLKRASVFNVSQVENCTFKEEEEAPKLDFNPIEEAENIWEGWNQKPSLEYGTNQASYSPSLDRIEMPNRETFKDEPSFYSVLFHESIHATGHGSRLDRETLTAKVAFGSETYAEEELVAEMGAAMLAGRAGFSEQTVNNSAAYCKGWIEVLKKDSRILLNAAGKAQKACDHILGV